MQRTWVVFALAGSTILTLLTSCDPETDAIGIFTKQGITLLEPVRGYIVPGGLVVLSGQSRPIYLDPLDDPNQGGNSEDNKNEIDFSAVFEAETKNKSTTADLALKLVSKVIPTFGANFSSGSQVTLDSIQSSGQRLLYPALKSNYLKQQNTATEIQSRLDDGSRVFVVQEIYKSKGLTLKSTTNAGGGIQVASGQAPPQCSSSTSGTQKAPSTTTSSDGSTAGGGSTATTSGAAKAKSTTSVTQSGSSTKSSQGGTPSATSGSAATPGGSLSVCFGPNNFTLSFSSDSELPFAVRLVEIVRKSSKDKTLIVKAGGAPIPGQMAAGAGNIGTVSARLDGALLPSIAKGCPKATRSSTCR